MPFGHCPPRVPELASFVFSGGNDAIHPSKVALPGSSSVDGTIGQAGVSPASQARASPASPAPSASIAAVVQPGVRAAGNGGNDVIPPDNTAPQGPLSVDSTPLMDTAPSLPSGKRAPTKWEDVSLVDAIDRALSHLGAVEHDPVASSLFRDDETTTNVHAVRAFLNRSGFEFTPVMQEFNVRGGPLMAVLRCVDQNRALILEVFVGAWTGFVFYNGDVMYYGSTFCVPERSSVQKMRACLNTLTDKFGVVVKNIFEVRCSQKRQKVDR